MFCRMLGITLVTAFLVLETASAEITIPSDGSDGVLHVTATDMTTRVIGSDQWGQQQTETAYYIDLGQAATGIWDSPSSNAGINTGRGIYDPAQWAVVFKYSSVNIESGAKIRFINHPSNPPVVWLVNGNVTINGEVNLDGRQGGLPLDGSSEYGLPGPGGFRAGACSARIPFALPGFGPGGGVSAGSSLGEVGIYSVQIGGMNDSFMLHRKPYGSANIIPLIGGSGGGRQGQQNGAGGGAILIASRASVLISGKLSCSGGSYASGGAIRVVADLIDGINGQVYVSGDWGSVGRVCLEAKSCNLSNITLDVDPYQPAFSDPPQLWPTESAPVVRIISVGGRAVTPDPKSRLIGGNSDITIQNDAKESLSVIVEAKNVPLNATVLVMVVPTSPLFLCYPDNSGYYGRLNVSANFVGGNKSLSTWQATIPGDEQVSALQVRADWDN